MPGTAHRYVPGVHDKPQVGDSGIIVTCPKNRGSWLEAKAADPGWSFWDFQRTPVTLKTDYPADLNQLIYVVHDGAIRYAFTIGSLEYGPREPVEDAAGYNPGLSSKGCRVWFEDVMELEKPIKMKGFQGFRYYKEATA